MGNRQNREAAIEYYQQVIERFRSSGFRIAADVQYKGQTFAYIAKKTTFEAEKYGFAETFFVFSEFDCVDLAALRNYSGTCFAYALRNRRIPLPRGLLRSTWCYPVVLVYGADTDVVQAVKNAEPLKHWGAYEFPVICDLASGQLHYSERSPWTSWAGYIHWDYLRDTAVEVLSPKKQVDDTAIADSVTSDTAVETLSAKERLRGRFLEIAAPWTRCPQFYRWQYWARFTGAMILLGAMADLVFGAPSFLFVMGIFYGIAAVAPYWIPARWLTFKIIGASDLPWPLPRLQMLSWRAGSTAIAALAIFFIYLGISR